MPALKSFIPALGALGVLVIAGVLLFPFAKEAAAGLKPAPVANAVAAEGVIESDEAGGGSVNVFPEVSGVVSATYVREGDAVKAGQPLFALDDTVQRAATENLRQQAVAAEVTLRKLRAPPRPELNAIAVAQVAQAKAGLKIVEDQHRKIAHAFALDPRSVSRDSLDGAADAVRAARSAVTVAQRQLDLLRAGASPFELKTQEAQTAAAERAYDGGKALLGKYVVTAPVAGTVSAVNVPKGVYVSPPGVYDSATEYALPAMTLARDGAGLVVRAYVDQAEMSRLPRGAPQAEMIVRGSDTLIPLTFVRALPTVIARVTLTPQDKDHGDPRVLPMIFRPRDPNVRLHPGELVDVYIHEN